MKVTLEKNGLTRTYNLGFNFWYFILGAWLPMFKGQIGKSMKHSTLFILTLGIYHFVQSFGAYNKNIVIDKLEKGWKPLTDIDQQKVSRL